MILAWSTDCSNRYRNDPLQSVPWRADQRIMDMADAAARRRPSRMVAAVALHVTSALVGLYTLLLLAVVLLGVTIDEQTRTGSAALRHDAGMWVGAGAALLFLYCIVRSAAHPRDLRGVAVRVATQLSVAILFAGLLHSSR